MANKYNRINVAGTGGASPAFSQSFLVANWSGPSSGEYTYSVAQASHGKGVNPIIEVYETAGADFDEVIVETTINASGDITLTVPEVPDTRFDGKIIVR